eukprot:3742032-Prymnesium_polylepis.1
MSWWRFHAFPVTYSHEAGSRYTGTREGTVPHRDKSARVPWPLGEIQVCVMLVCAGVSPGPRVTRSPPVARKML